MIDDQRSPLLPVTHNIQAMPDSLLMQLPEPFKGDRSGCQVKGADTGTSLAIVIREASPEASSLKFQDSEVAQSRIDRDPFLRDDQALVMKEQLSLTKDRQPDGGLANEWERCGRGFAEDAQSAIQALLALQRQPSETVRAPDRPSIPARPDGRWASQRTQLQSAIQKVDLFTSRFYCRYPKCGKRYASTDAVRKHCRQRHLEWLRQLGHGSPALYCRWEFERS